MTQAYQLGDLGQYLTVDTTGNNISLSVNSLSVGNSVTNVVINSTSFTSSANNTSYVGTVSAANVVSNAQLVANLANYTNTAGMSAYQTTAGLSANVATLTANNTSFVGTVSAANVVSNSQLTSNLANYQTTAGLSANVATLTANNTSYVGTVSAANVVSNAQLSGNLSLYGTLAGEATRVAAFTANNTSYVGLVTAANVVSNAQLSGNLANYQTTAGMTAYQTTAGLSANVATLTSNNATNAFGKTEGALNVNSATTALTANNSTNLGGVAASGYQTTAGLSANVATLTANNTSFVGSVSAANVVSNSQLSSNLANYQTTAGLSANVATLTANNASYLGTVAAASYVQNTDSRTLSGNLYFTGANNYFSTTVKVGANLYVNATHFSAGNSTVNTTHEAAQIQVANASQYANLNAGILYVGNSGTSASVNSTIYTGTSLLANNASYVGGNTAATLRSYSDTAAGTAYSNAIAYSGNAALAYANAIAYSGNSALAYSNAVSTAATDASTKAGTAYSNAIAYSGNSALAYANAIAYSGNSALAYSNAVSTAATDASTKAGTAYSNAIAWSGNAALAYANAVAAIATSTANNANYLGTVAAANYLTNSGSYTISGVHTHNANIVIGTTAAISANGGVGTAGQVLTSNGTTVYWSTVSAGGSYTFSTGLINTSSTITVNASYIATIASNSATYANASVSNTFTVGTAAYHVSNGNFGIGTSTPAQKLEVYSSTTNLGRIRVTGATTTSGNFRGFELANSSGFTGGMFQDESSNDLTFWTSAERMRINSSGNVGIGTTSPGYKLDVSGVIRGQSDLFLTKGSSPYIGTTDAYSLRLGAQNVDVLTLTNAGNVGIGTTSPAYPLDVNGLIGSKGGALTTRSSAATSGFVYNNFYDPNGNIAILCGAYSDPANYYRNTIHIFGSVSGTTEYMRIDASGNMGIGTTSPSTYGKLAIQGTGGATIGLVSNTTAQYDGAYLNLYASGASANYGMTSLQHVLMSGSADLTNYYFAIQQRSTTNSYVATVYAVDYKNGNHLWYSPNSGNERMRIDSSGNVGIGTTSATNKLTVAGNMSLQTAGFLAFGTGTANASNFSLYGDGTGTVLNHASLITFNIANVEKMRIDSSGNMYIGSTGSLSSERHLVKGVALGGTAGNVSYNSVFYTPDTSNATRLSILDYRVTTGSDHTTSRNKIQRRVDSTDMGYVGFDSTGTSIGWGTTESLRVNSVGNMGLGMSPSTDSTTYRWLQVAGANSTMGGVVQTQTSGGEVTVNMFNNNLAGYIGTGTSHPLLFRTNSTERMRIDTSGNLGIGTSSPDHPLTVVGGSAIAYFNSSGTQSYIRLSVNSDIAQRIEFVNRGGRTALWNPTGGDVFNILHSSGGVGINTSSPIRRLHIQDGSTNAEMALTGSSSTGTAFFNVSDSAGSNGTGWNFYIRGLGSSGGASVNLASVTIASSSTVMAGSSQSTIMYDYNDTGYYIDPNSTSKLNTIVTNSYLYFGSQTGSVNNTSSPLLYADGTNIVIKPGSGNGNFIFQDYSGNQKSKFNFPYGDWYIHYMYDIDDTGYHLDINGTSYLGVVSADRFYTGYDSGVGNSFSCSGWFRSSGGTGWYNSSYDGGIYMTDSTYVRVYNKALYSGISTWSPIFYDANDSGYYVDANGSTVLNYLYTAGALDVTGNVFGLWGTSPTMYFRDTDGQNGIWHCNSSTMYLLRADNSSSGYSTVGSGNWPMVCYLYSNDFVFGGQITSIYGMYANASDRRLKDNIVEIPNAIDKIKQIRGVTFSWNATADAVGFKPDQRDDVGVIAQEIQAVLPKAVHLAPFDTWSVGADEKFTVEEMIEKRKSSKSGENYLTVQMEKIVPLLIEGIKEQQLQIEGLQKQINDLINSVTQ